MPLFRVKISRHYGFPAEESGSQVYTQVLICMHMVRGWSTCMQSQQRAKHLQPGKLNLKPLAYVFQTKPGGIPGNNCVTQQWKRAMFSSHAKPLDDFFSSFIYPVLGHSMWRSASVVNAVVVLQIFWVCYVYSLSLELNNMNSFWFIGSLFHLCLDLQQCDWAKILNTNYLSCPQPELKIKLPNRRKMTCTVARVLFLGCHEESA